LMCGDVEVAEVAAAPVERGDRVARLEAELAELRREFEDFRRRFE
jgi:hypothetical protein